MGRATINAATRVAVKRLNWIPALVLAMLFPVNAAAGAETGRITLKVTKNDILVRNARVSIHKSSGESLNMGARTDKVGVATFVVPAGSYKFCVDYYGKREWSYEVHTLPGEETEVRLALEQLAADKTLDPHPVRFDGTPPEKEPVMLASLAGLSGILTQSTVAAVHKDRLYWFVNDHLGTPKMLLDENQEIVWQGTATPSGETVITVNTIENDFRFPGQYYDGESGLHYNYYRYYDYSTGRYLIADPIGLNGGINLFAYANMNPINLTDPFGLDGSWKVFSRSMSVTGGVPPGIKAPPIPWREYGEELKPSKNTLNSVIDSATIFGTAAAILENIPAALTFTIIGGTAKALKSTLYSTTPCNDALSQGIQTIVQAPPAVDPIVDKAIEESLRIYIESKDLPKK